jgi:hypothetical protein
MVYNAAILKVFNETRCRKRGCNAEADLEDTDIQYSECYTKRTYPLSRRKGAADR